MCIRDSSAFGHFAVSPPFNSIGHPQLGGGSQWPGVAEPWETEHETDKPPLAQTSFSVPVKRRLYEHAFSKPPRSSKLRVQLLPQRPRLRCRLLAVRLSPRHVLTDLPSQACRSPRHHYLRHRSRLLMHTRPPDHRLPAKIGRTTWRLVWTRRSHKVRRLLFPRAPLLPFLTLPRACAQPSYVSLEPTISHAPFSTLRTLASSMRP